MANNLLQREIIAFIEEHAQDDTNALLLKYKSIAGVPISLIVNQIEGRQKAKHKLPEFYNAKSIIYPPSLNLEQASSESTAKMKADFAREVLKEMGGIGADLTGGLGVDTYYLSKVFREMHYVEPDGELLKTARHNLEQLGASNVIFHQMKAEEFLNSTENSFDFIYIDPSRRSETNKKVFRFSECEPDILSLRNVVLGKTGKLLVKASPLFDLQRGIEQLTNVRRVLVISVDNECREVLFYCEKDFIGEPEIETLNKSKSGLQRFVFNYTDERNSDADLSTVHTFLFEPNASILKAGAFKSIQKRFGLLKLETNTHLYTGENIVKDFPGKVFRITSVIKPDAKAIQEILPERKANITTRNYPLSADELKKKLKIHFGGDKYLIACTDVDGKKLLIAKRIQ